MYNIISSVYQAACERSLALCRIGGVGVGLFRHGMWNLVRRDGEWMFEGGIGNIMAAMHYNNNKIYKWKIIIIWNQNIFQIFFFSSVNVNVFTDEIRFTYDNSTLLCHIEYTILL